MPSKYVRVLMCSILFRSGLDCHIKCYIRRAFNMALRFCQILFSISAGQEMMQVEKKALLGMTRVEFIQGVKPHATFYRLTKKNIFGKKRKMMESPRFWTL